MSAPINICLKCGGNLKLKGFLMVCEECGEPYEPDEVGMAEAQRRSVEDNR